MTGTAPFRAPSVSSRLRRSSLSFRPLVPAATTAAAGARAAAHLLEAIAAVHGLVAAWLERDLRFLTAVRARRRVHRARPAIRAATATAATGGTALVAALLAATRWVLESTGLIELLLRGRPDELVATVLTAQGLVGKHQGSPLTLLASFFARSIAT